MFSYWFGIRLLHSLGFPLMEEPRSGLSKSLGVPVFTSGTEAFHLSPCRVRAGWQQGDMP